MSMRKELVSGKLMKEIALEQYGYDLLRNKIGIQLLQQGKERREEISKHILTAEKELQERFDNSEENVLKEFQARRNLASSQRKIKAEGQIRQEFIQLQEEKLKYHTLVKQQHRLAQLVTDLKAHSLSQTVKQQTLIKEAQARRQYLLRLVQDSRMEEQRLCSVIDSFQRQL